LQPAAGQNVVRFTGVSYVTIRNLVLDGTSVTENATRVTTGAHHIRIQDCEIRNSPKSGVSTLSAGSPLSDNNEFVRLTVHDCGTDDHDHGFYVETANNLIEHCTIYDNAGYGIQLWNENGSPNTDVVNDNIVRYNRIYDNADPGPTGTGIILACGERNTAYYNIVYGNYRGIQCAYGTSATVYNNTVYNNGGYGIRISANMTGAIVRNNIMYNHTDDYYDQSDTIEDHNLEGIDPQFVNAGAGNFHLQAGSPARDAGTDVGLTEDYDGVSVPQETNPAIGAYEYVA
jgi:hypothetical protein